MGVTQELIELFEAAQLTDIENYIESNPSLLQNKELLGRAVRHSKFEVVQKVHAMGADNVQDAIGHIVYGADREIAEFLVEHGADPLNDVDPVPVAACEVLNSYALQLALELANDPLPMEMGEKCIAMLLSTYSRNPAEKKACFNLLEDNGIPIPDTLMMNMHRGEVDRVQEMIEETPEVLNQLFTEEEIYPPALGIKKGDGLHLTPLQNSSLLHIAVEFHDIKMVAMLLFAGANPNITAAIDEEGFGGHTPLFNAVVTYPPHKANIAELLAQHGAHLKPMASIKKRLRHTGNPDLEEPMIFMDVTPKIYAQKFPIGAWANWEALGAMNAEA